MNYRVKNISQPHGADASGAVIFSDNFTPPPVKKSILTGEAEGKVILVGDALAAPPEELYVFGETSQNGEPTPESPLELISAGSVFTTGAQLFDINRVVSNDYVVNNGDGSLTVNTPEGTTGVEAGGNVLLSNYCPNMEVGKTYTLTLNSTAQTRKYIYLRESKVIWESGKSRQITEEDLASMVLWYAENANDTSVVSDIMINEGSESLPYEPYTGGKPAVNPEAGEIGVEVYGGNLFDANRTELLDVNISDPPQRYGVKMSNLGSGKYTISTNKKDTDVDRYIYATIKHYDGSYSGTMYIVAQKVINTITIDIVSGDELIIYNAIRNDLSTTIELFKEFGIKVEYGEYATAYEPYKQLQTVTLSTPGGLPGIPVSSDGNYTDAEGQQWLSDSIEYKNEKLMYVQRVETLRLLTDVGSIDSQNGYLNINNFLNADITRRSGSLCTHLTYGDTRGDNVFWIDSSGTGVRIKISKYTKSEEYLSWLAENEVYLTYPCANPIEKEISDPNLINQLKSLRLNSPNTTIVNDANAFQKLKYLKETFTMANVNFRFGTYEQYKAVASKDTNTLYFADGVIYKGDAPYSQKVEMVSAFPEITNAAQGVLYVNSSTYEARFFNGTDFTTVFVGTVGNMDDAGNDAKVVTQAAVKAYIAKQLADANIPTDSAINEKINTAKEEAITEAVSQAGTAADQKDAALKTQLEQTMDTKIAAQVASVFRFKGSKANKGEIDAIEGMVTGDVWHSEDDGKEYVYDGEAWELLGFTVDLSAYATTAAVTEAINAKAEELTSAIATAKSEAIAAAKAETTSQVNAHAGDKTIHITGEERTAWNAKADTSYVDSAKQAAITAAASDATTKANQALTDAKAYTDQKNSAMDTRMKAVEAAVTWGEIA